MYDTIQLYTQNYEKMMEDTFPEDIFSTLKSGKGNISQKEITFKKKIKAINSIEYSYLTLVNKLNDYSKSKGKNNYITLKSEEFGIPTEILHKTFLSEGQKIYERLKNKINLPKTENYDYYTIFGNVSLEPVLKSITDKRLGIDEIINRVFAKNDISKNYKARIKIDLNDDYLHMSTYDYDRKDTTIYLSNTFSPVPKDFHILDSYIISHEIGHCIQYLQIMDKGLDPLESSTKFEREVFATSVQDSFAKSLDNNFNFLVRSQQIYEYIIGLFEYKVFVDTPKDLSKLYAKINNKFRWYSQQNDNPFYIADYMLHAEPGMSVLYPTAHLDFIEKLVNKN